MKNKLFIYIFISFILTGCAGVSSKGLFGTGVSVALDPRTIGTQIDDSIMQKTISAKILAKDRKYVLSVKTKVLDGRIFVTGKVDNPEEKPEQSNDLEEDRILIKKAASDAMVLLKNDNVLPFNKSELKSQIGERKIME